MDADSFRVDMLIELGPGSLHVVDSKAKRFLIDEVKADFELDKELLQECGIAHHGWSNYDLLTPDISHLGSELPRVRFNLRLHRLHSQALPGSLGAFATCPEGRCAMDS